MELSEDNNWQPDSEDRSSKLETEVLGIVKGMAISKDPAVPRELASEDTEVEVSYAIMDNHLRSPENAIGENTRYALLVVIQASTNLVRDTDSELEYDPDELPEETTQKIIRVLSLESKQELAEQLYSKLQVSLAFLHSQQKCLDIDEEESFTEQVHELHLELTGEIM